ncbi:hypothetical protein DPMN_015343 [Dreissena polymorpha]|uniref:Uncharacterized protein n=1 Tax=Dreissena polymorpha TaxID=45954 RepID=A0A9D4NBB6_DREPO|nr:hypothetical protein DPMN_015343 [Dreissena polymorpha]
MSYRNVALINWVSVGQTITYKDELTTYMRTMAPISSLGIYAMTRIETTRKCVHIVYVFKLLHA